MLGVEPEVISGDEEAALSFAGASSVLPVPGADQVLVVDLGGGSTEFVLGDANGVIAAKSVDVGCVRMTERHLRSDPPIAGADRCRRGRRRRRHQRARGWTFRWNAPPPSSALRGPSPPLRPMRFACRNTRRRRSTELNCPSALRAKPAPTSWRCPRPTVPALPYMHPGRVDVMGAGGLVWRRILERLADVTDGRIVTASGQRTRYS